MSYSCFSCPNHSCLCSLHTPSTPVHCCIWPCKYPNTANAEVKHANNGKREKNWGGARQMAAASSIHWQRKGSKNHLLFWTLDQFCSDLISNLFELTNNILHRYRRDISYLIEQQKHIICWNIWIYMSLSKAPTSNPKMSCVFSTYYRFSKHGICKGWEIFSRI